MTIKAPKIDPRNYDQIVDQTAKLVQQFTGHNPGPKSPGDALIRIFVRYAELLIERLNQVPEKNFLAYLDLIGSRLTPPRAARVPLTFELSAGNTSGALVPSRTVVSAPPPDGEEEEVVFETKRELSVSASTPIAAYALDPVSYCWSNISHVFDRTNVKPVNMFRGIHPIRHRLYLSQKEVLTLPGPKTVLLAMDFMDDVQPANLPIAFSAWDGSRWQSLPAEISAISGSRWQVTLKNPPIPSPTAIQTVEAAWICLKPAKPLPALRPAPAAVVHRITAGYQVEKTDLVPDHGFANTVQLDQSKDFYPFGEQPRFNDTFYIASQEAFSKPGASVTLKIVLSNSTDPAGTLPEVKASKNLKLVWEYWNAETETWEYLAETGPGAGSAPAHGFDDGTGAFTNSGSVRFDCPAQMGPVEVNGQNGCWIRVRIANGIYGIEAHTVTKTIKVKRELTLPRPAQTYKMKFDQLQPVSYHPPIIQSLSIGYTHTAREQELDAVVCENNFVLEKHGRISSGVAQGFNLFKFVRQAGTAAYLGFELPFENRPITLYADVAESQTDGLSTEDDNTPLRLTWEYASSQDPGWTRLEVQDETRALTESGLISFSGPRDLIRRPEFGRNLYWLRVRRQDGRKFSSPRLRRLLLNTVWAEQAQSFRNKILGSSNGEPDQVFTTIQTPLLSGPCIEVREPELLSADEKKNIESEEGRDAVSVVRDSADKPEEIWVRWHEVQNFLGSSSRDRHYVINHMTGELQFGDGKHGMIPPQGHNTIRASHYRTGGGKRGNVPVGAVAQLKSTLPYIDSVVNWVEAGGGAEIQDIASLKKRGPRVIRHRDRAVTYRDFKDLAYAASSDVTRVFVTFPRHQSFGDRQENRAGRINLVIVPRSPDPRPQPGQGLKRRVRNYILSRCEPGIDVQIASANWIEVSVTAEIVPVSMEASGNLPDVIQDTLQCFLHPLKGGFENQGWAFGRVPHRSEFYRLIESIEGVDHISFLKVYPDSEIEKLPRHQLEKSLVVSGRHAISLAGI